MVSGRGTTLRSAIGRRMLLFPPPRIGTLESGPIRLAPCNRTSVHTGPRYGAGQMGWSGGLRGLLGEVAEWQTRTVQVRVPERA